MQAVSGEEGRGRLSTVKYATASTRAEDRRCVAYKIKLSGENVLLADTSKRFQLVGTLSPRPSGPHSLFYEYATVLKIL